MPLMHARGRVLAIADGMARVEFPAPSACGACRAHTVCGSGHGRVMQMPVSPDVHPGDALELALPAAEFNAATLVGYLLPALATVSGALLLSAFGDAAAALGAAAGLALGLSFARAWSARWHAGPPGASGCTPHSLPGEHP